MLMLPGSARGGGPALTRAAGPGGRVECRPRRGPSPAPCRRQAGAGRARREGGPGPARAAPLAPPALSGRRSLQQTVGRGKRPGPGRRVPGLLQGGRCRREAGPGPPSPPPRAAGSAGPETPRPLPFCPVTEEALRALALRPPPPQPLWAGALSGDTATGASPALRLQPPRWPCRRSGELHRRRLRVGCLPLPSRPSLSGEVAELEG